VSGTEVAVQAGELRMSGTATADVAVGDRVVAAVRPEDVLVSAPDGPDGTPATVEVVGYQGRELAVEVRTSDGRALHLRTEQRLAPGDAVTLTIDPQRLLVYPLAAGEHVPEPLVAAVPS
jgi:putative spermidine/putrescine transport system ATP-binding protein